MSDEQLTPAAGDAGHAAPSDAAAVPPTLAEASAAAPVDAPAAGDTAGVDAATGDATSPEAGLSPVVEKVLPADFSAVAIDPRNRGEDSPVQRPIENQNERDDAKPLAEFGADPEEEVGEKRWYILKVQSNREESIREALLRRVKIAGLDRFFGDVFIPTEMVTEFKNGKKRIVKRKLYPGYIMAQMAVNDESWFLVRDTPGIGDFTGAGGRPAPMPDSEVNRLINKQEEKAEEAPKLKIAFKVGDRVKINEGTFENFEGEVHNIDQANGRVTVMINIFGRSTPVELEYWQIETV